MLSHWQEAFLVALRRTGNMSAAAIFANRDRSTVYYHRDRNRRFSKAIERALSLHAESNVERAIVGTESAKRPPLP